MGGRNGGQGGGGWGRGSRVKGQILMHFHAAEKKTGRKKVLEQAQKSLNSWQHFINQRQKVFQNQNI